jgi:hypothetical protein
MMRNKLILGSLALMASGTAIVTTPAVADPYYSNGYYASDGRYYYSDGGYYDNGRYYDRDGQDRDSRYYEGETTYRGRSHYYRHHCGGGNGAVGTVAGGVGGAVIGHSLGGTAGTVLGGVGGALLGRHLDKENTRDRRGC